VALEAFLAYQEQTLFDLNRSIVLYDLTNTYFEGQYAANPKAHPLRPNQRKAQRLPIDHPGIGIGWRRFSVRYQVFPGNASEPTTLSLMLDGLQGKNPLTVKPVVSMDAGIANAENIAWLIEQGYQYLVVSREDALIVRQTTRNSLTCLSRNRCGNQRNPDLLPFRTQSQK
jgi:hypothetical protein